MATHAFKRGDRVIVRNETLGGRPIVEGTATIVRPLHDDDHHYEVCFDSEKYATYERFVRPDDAAAAD